MSAIPRSFITPEEYLIRERAAQFKSEYLRGEMFAMAGAQCEHCELRDNLSAEILIRLGGKSCRPYSADMRVCISSGGLYTYPDISIVCGEPEFQDNVFDTLLNPIVIIEVLSESTEEYDRGAKFDHYRQISSLREYVLVSKNQMLVESHARTEDDKWVLSVFRGPAKPFELTSVPLSTPLGDIYRDVQMPEHPRRWA